MFSDNPATTDTAAASAAVEQLILRTWWNIDHEDGHGGETFFTPDGVCEMPAMTLSGRHEIAEGYAARRADGTRVSRHVVSNLQLEVEPRLRMQASYILVVHAGMGSPPLTLRPPQAVCDLRDWLVWHDGGYLIEHRRLDTVFVAEDTDSVMLRRPQ